MLALKQNQPEPEASPRKAKLRWHVLLGDLSLLISLTIARFIVWRTLRRREHARTARRKQFRLIRGGDYQAEKKAAS
ncbi:MAG TPA: hypothetical protein VGC91_15810 [Pyrinomonadaceae bacterium]|jgi:hypothetical protein